MSGRQARKKRKEQRERRALIAAGKLEPDAADAIRELRVERHVRLKRLDEDLQFALDVLSEEYEERRQATLAEYREAREQVTAEFVKGAQLASGDVGARAAALGITLARPKVVMPGEA